MIDVLSMNAKRAILTGSAVRALDRVQLDGPRHIPASGVVTFDVITPSTMVRWKSAELNGDFSADSARVRLTDGVGVFFIDETADMAIVPVVDPTQWDTQWSTASLLESIDLWTNPSLGVIVGLVRTPADPTPFIRELRVLAQFPTWIGAAHQVVQDIVDGVSAVTVLGVETDTVEVSTQSWNIGTPWTELNMSVVELVQVTVDGAHKSATLVDGVVTLLGPPATPGQTVVIAVRFLPSAAVRRAEHVSTIDTLPAWWLQELIVAGGQTGRGPKIMVGCYDVHTRRVEVKMIVNGVAARTRDAIQMRAALQEAFASGLDIVLPSCRQVSAHLDGMVEVVTKSGTNFPMASGIVQCSFVEFVSAQLVKNPRVTAQDGSVSPVRTQINTNLPDGVVIISDYDSIGDIC